MKIGNITTTGQKQRICRWGILGSARIARKYWRAIYNADNATLQAVASREQEKAKQFIQAGQAEWPFDLVPDAMGGYEALLRREDIDAVYIPLPTAIRSEWVIKAAKAGKHVLCEKPCATTVAELMTMLDVCQQHNVQFMDGVMFMHNRRLAAIRDILDTGISIGNVTRITSQFTFAGSEQFLANDIRTNSQLEPLGCLGDLGWYNIRFALWVMNYVMPEKVCGRLLQTYSNKASPDEVAIEFSGELFFPQQVSAGFYCTFLAEREQWVNISGTKGRLYMDDFVNGAHSTFQVNHSVLDCDGQPVEIAAKKQIIDASNDNKISVSQPRNACQITRMIHTFSTCVVSQQLDSHWPTIALQTQQIVNACLHSAESGGGLVNS